ncbi:unnamed protein product [Linum tenue]|uniref:Uncharacterized protein n=1 Tax=Linum tenue TaxID=586396 RepID=A0AAV0IV46_9ROSI|nr:unnamed protein product [Linum tenue]
MYVPSSHCSIGMSTVRIYYCSSSAGRMFLHPKGSQFRST